MNKRNFISSLVVMAFFAFFFWQAQALKQSAAYWPKLICIVGIALSLANALIAGIKWTKEKDREGVFPLNKKQLLNSLILLAVAACWMFCIPRIGYLVSSFTATCILVLVFEPIKDRKHIVRDVIVTLIFSGLIYGLFALLGVHFPKGLLI